MQWQRRDSEGNKAKNDLNWLWSFLLGMENIVKLIMLIVCLLRGLWELLLLILQAQAYVCIMDNKVKK